MCSMHFSQLYSILDSELPIFYFIFQEIISLQILSHMRETSDVFVCDIMKASTKLVEVVEKKSEARTLLAIERKKRESLRKTTDRIRRSAGLLATPAMLRKMEVDLEALNILKRKARKLMDDDAVSIDPDNAAAMPEK